MLIKELEDYLGFAVAGNFANHLGEAGEADEFSVIKTQKENEPKGIFPFYIKDHNSFLSTYPLCEETILTHGREKDKIQAEPEVALICDFVYEDKKVIDIIPKYFAAFNDCSLRVQNKAKLSTKKNWGKATKGISKEFIKIDEFTEEGNLNKFHISSFIKRDGKVYNYGSISAVNSYSYFFTQLKDWLIDKFNTQEDCGPLEELSQFMTKANEAKGILIAAGATSYCEFAKNNFLKKGDELFIYVYNSRINSHQVILNNVNGDKTPLKECSRLHQIVR